MMTTIPTATEPSRQMRRARARAQARTTPSDTDGDLTQSILDAAAAKAAAAAQAQTLGKAQLAQAEIQAWLKDMDARLEVIFNHPEQNLGEIEEQLARSIQEPLRLVAQRAAQVKANAVPCQCPKCHDPLREQRWLSRTIHSRFGQLTIWRRYGFCSRCGQWHFPADYALGLGRKAPASPYVQEISALLVSKMPVDQAVLVAGRLGLTCLVAECTRKLTARGSRLRTGAPSSSANSTPGKRYSNSPPPPPKDLPPNLSPW